MSLYKKTKSYYDVSGNHKSVNSNSSIFFLILIAIFCTLCISLLHTEVAQSHQNYNFESSDTNSNSSKNSFQHKYFLIEEDDSDKQKLEELLDLPGFLNHQSLAYVSLVCPESFFDSINSFHYNSTFGFYLLRSPPSLFS